MPADPCSTCAYRQGAAAHRELYNRFRADVCAMTGVPFWCHHSFDWKTQGSRMTREEFHANQMKICEGWRREVVKYVKPGLLSTFARLVRRWKGEAILMLVEIWRDSEGEDKRQAGEDLHNAIAGLHAEDGFTELVHKGGSHGIEFSKKHRADSDHGRAGGQRANAGSEAGH